MNIFYINNTASKIFKFLFKLSRYTLFVAKHFVHFIFELMIINCTYYLYLVHIYLYVYSKRTENVRIRVLRTIRAIIIYIKIKNNN